MGKLTTAKSSSGKKKSLADQYYDEERLKSSTRSKERKRKITDDEFVDDKLTKRILSEARIQQEELQEEYGARSATESGQLTVKLGTNSDEEWEDVDSDHDDAAGDSEEVVVNAEDEKAMELFMSSAAPARRTLADIIQEKLTEKQTEIQSQMSDVGSLQMQDLDPRVVEMYKKVKSILSKYRSGKLPKAFKILYLTEPEAWSAAAMYQATRIFASNLNAKMAQRFYNLVLYPRIRDDIGEFKRLNFHLYQALRKALFKPAAFFKGILLPLAECGTCSLREAVIVSSVLSKNSIPMLHSAAAILKIAEMDYSGACSIFLRTLLDKKYALPYRVVDAVVFHFLKFKTDRRTLPVLWHQAFLTFAQRYKQDISSEQKDALLELLRVHVHEQITPEVRREIVAARPRDLEDATPKDVSMGD